MRPEAIFFDLYGTLLIYGDMTAAWSAWLTELHRWLREHGAQIDRPELARRCEGFFSWPAPAATDNDLTVYERRLGDFAAELGVEAGPEDLRRMAPATIAAWQEYVDLDPQAHGVLTRLANTHPLALITNFDHPPHVYRVLEETDLRRHFSSVVVSGEIGLKKPDPRIFEPAVRAVGVAPRDIAYVGDAPEDILAAHGAGMAPIRLRRDGDTQGDKAADFRHSPTPRRWTEDVRHSTVSSLGEVPDLILRS